MSRQNVTAEGFSTFASIGGCDIVVLMNGELVGEIQAISVSISREKAPIHVMGRPDALGFSRGKRGIAGSMVGVVFGNSWLAHAMRGGRHEDPERKTYFHAADAEWVQFRHLVGDIFDNKTPGERLRETGRQVQQGNSVFFTGKRPRKAWYVDQILPFNSVIVGANEYGGATARIISGCELLNEASGSSVDDIMLDESHTYVALHASPYMGLQFKSPLKGEPTGQAAAEQLFSRARADQAAQVFQDLQQ